MDSSSVLPTSAAAIQPASALRKASDNFLGTVEELTEKINSLRHDSRILEKDLPQKYDVLFSTQNKIKGLLFAAIFATIIVSYVLLVTNDFLVANGCESIPQIMTHFFQNKTQLAISMGVVCILAGGGKIVVRRALTREDPLIGNNVGKLSGSSHIHEVIICRIEYSKEKKTHFIERKWGYLDKSTLDERGMGKAYLYSVKTLDEHYGVSTVVTLSTSLYLILVLVMDIIRLVVVPFYILFCWSIEQCFNIRLFSKEKYPNERKFELNDILRATVESIKRIVQAPFYAFAYMGAAFYSLVVDPFHGRKLAFLIERDWNQGVTRAQGCWSVQGYQTLWPGWGVVPPKKKENNNESHTGLLSYVVGFTTFIKSFWPGMGIVAPNGLHINAGYDWAGCWWPIGIVEFGNEGKVNPSASLAFAVSKGKAGKVYHVFSREEIACAVTTFGPLQSALAEVK